TSGCSALDCAGRQAGNELLCHGQIEDEDRHAAQGEHREYFCPVGVVLTPEARHAEHQGPLRVLPYEDEGEPEVVPDGHEVEDRYGGERRPHEVENDRAEYPPGSGAIHDGRFGELLWDAPDELKKGEQRYGHSAGHIHRDHAPVRVEQMEVSHHQEKVDAPDLDGDGQPGNEEEINPAGNPYPPPDASIGCQRTEQHDQEQRQNGDDHAVEEIQGERAVLENGEIAAVVDAMGQPERIEDDVVFELERVHDHGPQWEQDDEGPQREDDVLDAESALAHRQTLHGLTILPPESDSSRAWVRRRATRIPAMSTMKVRVATAAPSPISGIPAGCCPAMPVL